jgi:HlyD family secretion protein
MKNKKVTFTIIGLAVICFFFLIKKSCSGEKKSIKIETVKAVKGNISNTVTATGTIEAIKTVAVGTQVSGIVNKIYADYNSVVKKGQILAEIDKAPLLTQYSSAEASFDDAKAEDQYQKSNFERIKALYDKKLVADADFEQAQYNYKRAEASLKISKANFEKAKVNLDYATIYSPIDGVVLDRAVDEGQTVAASFNTPTLFSIANDLTQMQVQADIDEADIGQVQDGQKVNFSVDAYSGVNFTGVVTEIRLKPKTTSNVVTYTVVIKAPNPDKKLMPGMTANITIITEEANDVITVPAKTLQFRPDSDLLATYYKSLPEKDRPAKMEETNTNVKPKNAGLANMPKGAPQGTFDNMKMPQMVWVKEGFIIHPVRIETGINDGVNVEVKSGLKEGADVVTELLSGSKTRKSTATEERSPFMPQRPRR